jgi:hypothetical protein
MSDRKPVVIAVTVGALALAANGAAAVVAVSAAAPPQAAVFGITGLTAAFIGLITTILWAWRDEAQPQRPRGRVFTPWVPPQDDTEAYFLPQPVRAGQPLALAAAPTMSLLEVPAPKPAPVAEGRVIYLQEWVKAHAAPRVNA